MMLSSTTPSFQYAPPGDIDGGPEDDSHPLFLLLCGGKGTRFAADTPRPKPTMTVYGIPMYRWALDSLARALERRDINNNDLLIAVDGDDETLRDVPDAVAREYLDRSCFRTIRGCTLPLSTPGPVDSARLALLLSRRERRMTGTLNKDGPPLWIIDNDVVHDPATVNFDFDHRRGDSKRTVKVVVVDARSSSSCLHEIEGGNDFLSPGHPTPYAHVHLSPDGSQVVAISEKDRLAQRDRSPYVVMGAYGFGSLALFDELCADVAAAPGCLDCPPGAAGNDAPARIISRHNLSDLVRAAVLNPSVRVVPIVSDASFTVGTPTQVQRTLRCSRRARELMNAVRGRPSTWVFEFFHRENQAILERMTRLATRARFDGHRVVASVPPPPAVVVAGDDEQQIQTQKQARVPPGVDMEFDAVVYHNQRPHDADVYVNSRAVNPGTWTSPTWAVADLGYGYADTVCSPVQRFRHNMFRDLSSKPPPGTCIKTASSPDDLRGYAYYLLNAPPPVRAMAPKFYGQGGKKRLGLGSETVDAAETATFLEMEWIDGVALSTLNAWGLVGPGMFADVLETLRFLHRQQQQQHQSAAAVSPATMMANYMPKLERRLESHRHAYRTRWLPGLPLDDIVARLHRFFSQYDPVPRACIHGDFWLGNVLRQHSDGAFRIVDMRGSVGDVLSVGGDAVYDFAKLYQSVLGFDLLLVRPDVYAVALDSRRTPTTTTPVRKNTTSLTVQEKLRLRFTDMLAEHVAVDTAGRVSMRQVKHVALCLLLGCVPFHAASVEAHPHLWTHLIADLYQDACDVRVHLPTL